MWTRCSQSWRGTGYTDFERGERGSTVEHLDVLDYKIQQEEARADALNHSVEKKQEQLSGLQKKVAVTKQAAATFAELDGMAKPKAFGKMEVAAQDWKTVSGLAKKGVTADSEIEDLKKELAAPRRNKDVER